MRSLLNDRLRELGWRIFLARPLDLALYRQRPSILYYLPWWALAALMAFCWWML